MQQSHTDDLLIRFFVEHPAHFVHFLQQLRHHYEAHTPDEILTALSLMERAVCTRTITLPAVQKADFWLLAGQIYAQISSYKRASQSFALCNLAQSAPPLDHLFELHRSWAPAAEWAYHTRQALQSYTLLLEIIPSLLAPPTPTNMARHDQLQQVRQHAIIHRDRLLNTVLLSA